MMVTTMAEATTTPEVQNDIPIRVVVGLGNPGLHYANTRHNIGFMVVDRLLTVVGGRWEEGLVSDVAVIGLSPADIILVKPKTFMNHSGQAIKDLQKENSFVPAQVLVVFDDFNLPFSKVRLRRGGSDGGHNGLASVIEAMRTDAVPRLRLGIGKTGDGDDINFVLNEFPHDAPVDALVERGCRAIKSCVNDGLDAAMNRFNGCPLL